MRKGHPIVCPDCHGEQRTVVLTREAVEAGVNAADAWEIHSGLKRSDAETLTRHVLTAALGDYFVADAIYEPMGDIVVRGLGEGVREQRLASPGDRIAILRRGQDE